MFTLKYNQGTSFLFLYCSIVASIAIAENDITQDTGVTLPEDFWPECECPEKSYCSYTADTEQASQGDWWPVSGMDSFWFNCTCKDGWKNAEGFTDGWRCDPINECEEGDWPCAPKYAGGYCVDTHPHDEESPKYKCGCNEGYIADVTSEDEYGFKNCLKVEQTYSFDQCPNENNILSFASLDVIGNPDLLSIDKNRLEQLFQISYEEVLPSQCSFRLLENTTLLGFENEEGEVISLTNSSPIARYLISGFDTEYDDEAADTTETTEDLGTTALFGLNEASYLENDDDSLNGDETTSYLEEDDDSLNGDETTSYLEEDDDSLNGDETSPSSSPYLEDDDNDNFNEVISYNFTLFFSMIMRCFGCPDDAKLFDDASRRHRRTLLRKRFLQDQEDTCICQLEDGSIEDAQVDNVAPPKNFFLDKFNDELKSDTISSVKVALTVDEEDLAEVPFEVQGINEESEEETSSNNCNNSCNLDGQFCNENNQCVCLPGLIQPSGVGGTCQDLNECASSRENNCSRVATCTNTYRSYTCTCNSGFIGNGTTCVDIDECTIGTHNCTGKADVCVNYYGGFNCFEPTSSPTRQPTGPAPVAGRPFVDKYGNTIEALAMQDTLSWTSDCQRHMDFGNNTKAIKSLGEKWTRNALGEHASIASFAAFTIALMTNQAPPSLIQDSLNAAADEYRHAQISFEIASLLLGKSVGPEPFPPSSHEFGNNMTTLALRTAEEGCIGETLSALLVAEEVDQGIDDYEGISDSTKILLKDKSRTIVIEESRHAILAWKTIVWVCTKSKEACEAVVTTKFLPENMNAALERFLPNHDENLKMEGKKVFDTLVSYLINKTNDWNDCSDNGVKGFASEGSLVEQLANVIINGVICSA